MRGRAGSFGAMARAAIQRSRKILANTGWMLGERVVQLVAGVFVGIWIARYLGPEQFGLLNYSVAFVALFLPLFSFGLNHIVTRELLKEPDKEGEIIGTAYALRLMMSLTTFGAIWLITSFMHGDAQTRMFIMIVAFASLFDTFAVLQYWFGARLAYRWITIANCSALLICSAVRIVLILVEAPLVWFVVATASDVALGGLFGLWAYLHLGNRLSSWSVTFGRAKRLLYYAWPLIFSSVLATINLKIDQVMIGDMLGDREVGIYSTAAKLSEIWYFVPIAIATSLMPSLIASRDRSAKEYGERLQLSLDILATIAYALAIFVAIFAHQIIYILYGPAYADAGLILSLHIWGGIFVFMRAILSKWLIIEDLLIYSLVTHGMGALLNVLLNLWAIPAYGILGATVATLISYAASSYLTLLFSPTTRAMAWKMTIALAAPVRLPIMLVRKL
ncbi:flippase [Marinivivus vitaminiproducens]|uniref:flippase n=1 Tax=Marinivivus vitaminiproducens TaxID=3035935 RepID=UPI00279D0788|nr:flippase [Geminicoccaceae bacterium SCSIO 64248]